MDLRQTQTNDRTTLSFTMPAEPASVCSEDLLRVLCAAIVNRQFRQRLLARPLATISAGYGGMAFHLTEDEHEILATLQVSTLPDFSRCLFEQLQAKQAGPEVADSLSVSYVQVDHVKRAKV